MKKIIFFLFASFLFATMVKAQTVASADEVIRKACVQAAKEKKKVMVIFHASWCGWCHKMDASLNDPSVKDFFERNYVITHLTILESDDKKKLENSGAEELNEKWGGKGQGIPFWVILDQDAKLLADSQIQPGQNVGCPATNEEVDYFLNVLKKTSSISNEQIEAVKKRFRKNE